MQVHANEHAGISLLPYFTQARRFANCIGDAACPLPGEREAKGFPMPTTESLSQRAEASTQHSALHIHDLWTFQAQGSVVDQPQMTEAETEIQRGPVATPGHSAR